MDINIYYLRLLKWFKPHSLDSIVYSLQNKDETYCIKLNVFYNALETYTLLVTSYDMSKVVYEENEFLEVCKSQNIGIIKDILVIFEKYLRSNGYKGKVQIAQILEYFSED